MREKIVSEHNQKSSHWKSVTPQKTREHAPQMTA
jgi:hypothetical protein